MDISSRCLDDGVRCKVVYSGNGNTKGVVNDHYVYYCVWSEVWHRPPFLAFPLPWFSYRRPLRKWYFDRLEVYPLSLQGVELNCYAMKCSFSLGKTWKSSSWKHQSNCWQDTSTVVSGGTCTWLTYDISHDSQMTFHDSHMTFTWHCSTITWYPQVTLCSHDFS